MRALTDDRWRVSASPRRIKLRIFQWSDANGGSWFEKGAGLSLVERSPLAPGRF